MIYLTKLAGDVKIVLPSGISKRYPRTIQHEFSLDPVALVVDMVIGDLIRNNVPLSQMTIAGVVTTNESEFDTQIALVFPDTDSGDGGSGENAPWKTLLSAAFTIVGPVALSTTTYAQVTGRAAAFSTEQNTQYVITETCKILHLYVVTSNAQPASGSFEITLRVNGVSTTLKVTIPAGSAAGAYSDTVHSIDLVAGDLFCYELKNNATDPSATIISIGSTLQSAV